MRARGEKLAVTRRMNCNRCTDNRIIARIHDPPIFPVTVNFWKLRSNFLYSLDVYQVGVHIAHTHLRFSAKLFHMRALSRAYRGCRNRNALRSIANSSQITRNHYFSYNRACRRHPRSFIYDKHLIGRYYVKKKRMHARVYTYNCVPVTVRLYDTMLSIPQKCRNL